MNNKSITHEINITFLWQYASKLVSDAFYVTPVPSPININCVWLVLLLIVRIRERFFRRHAHLPNNLAEIC